MSSNLSSPINPQSLGQLPVGESDVRLPADVKQISPATSEPLAQALVRAREALNRQALPADLEARVMQASGQAMALRRNAALAVVPKRASPAWLAQAQLAWRSVGAKLRWPQASPWAWAGSAGSFALGALGVVVLGAQPPSWPSRSADTVAFGSNDGGLSATASFLPLDATATVQFAQPAGAKSNRPVSVVSVVLSQAQLSAFGVPFNPASASGAVRAELLLDTQGQAVAVRFLP